MLIEQIQKLKTFFRFRVLSDQTAFDSTTIPDTLTVIPPVFLFHGSFNCFAAFCPEAGTTNSFSCNKASPLFLRAGKHHPRSSRWNIAAGSSIIGFLYPLRLVLRSRLLYQGSHRQHQELDFRDVFKSFTNCNSKLFSNSSRKIKNSF